MDMDKNSMELSCDVRSLLGRGGFGHVFNGRLNSIPVAVKRIEHVKRCDDKEEKALMKLDHPNTVKLLYTKEDENFKYYVFELCAGSLDKVFLPENDPRKYQGPPLPRPIKVIFQLAEGLAYIHSKGLVHRDIKPENVLISTITEPVTLKWADFGLTIEATDDNTYENEIGEVVGTIDWLAPELLAFLNQTGPNRFTNLTDVFSAGCIFFKFFSEIHPFGENFLDIPQNILHNNPVNFENLPYSHFAHNIITEMLKRVPLERLKMKEVVCCIRKKMEEELFRQCSLQNPTDIEVDQLAQLLNDKDCPQILTVDIEDCTPLELLCSTNQSHKLKHCIELVLMNHEKKNGKKMPLDATWALDFVCKNHNLNDDLLDIVQLLIEKTKINFNRSGLRLQTMCSDLLRNWNGIRYEGELDWLAEKIIKRRLLLTDFNEYNFENPDFIISDLFQKYLQPLKRGPPYSNRHQTVPEWSLLESYATIEDIAMCRILPHLKTNIEEKIPMLISSLENQIKDLQLEFDHRKAKFQQDFQISNLFINFFFNKQWKKRPELNNPTHLCQLIELLLENGLSINARDHECEMNALHLLCCYYEGTASLEVTKLLIEKGIDINARCPKQRTALHYLLSNGNVSNEVEISKLLIEKGIDVNALDIDGKNPLHSLCSSYKVENVVELVKILLENGVDINVTDDLGRNALHFLCHWETHQHRKPKKVIETMKFLIENGIDIHKTEDLYYETVLHCLSKCFYKDKTRVELAKFLLDNAGADIDAKDGYGRTALHCLLSTYNGKIMFRLFIEKGIDVGAEDDKGNDAWYYLKNKYRGKDKAEIEKMFLSAIMPNKPAHRKRGQCQ